MVDFTESEKKRLLDAAASQTQLHTYLMGMNGSPGFCKLVETRLEGLDILEKRQNHLEGRTQWLIGILIGASAIVGVVEFFIR